MKIISIGQCAKLGFTPYTTKEFIKYNGLWCWICWYFQGAREYNGWSKK